MAFKMKGSPFQRNFGIGASPMKNYQDGYYKKGALKKDDVAYGGTRTWKEGEDAAGRHKQNLNDLVRERNKHDKGTNPYATAQNKINQFLGSSKRHELKADETTKVKNVETKKSDKNVIKNTETGEKEKLKTKYYDEEKTQIKKEKLVDKDGDGTSKTVVKYDKDGNVIKEKGYTTGDKKNNNTTETTTTTTEKSKKEKRQAKKAENKKKRQNKRAENKKKLEEKRNASKGTGSFG